MAFSFKIAAILLLVAIAGVAEAQSDCASQLIPCVDSLNATTPQPACCTAIRTVVTTQLQCLCRLYNNPGLLTGINMTQALTLPQRCGIPGDVNACTRASAPSPPVVPGGGSNGNGASTMSWIGMPALLLISAFTFLY